MSKTYKPYDPNQSFLLPPNPRDWLPDDHVVFFIDELVNRLDLSKITSKYEAELRGQPPHHPTMMVKVLFYAYTQKVHSTRRMETRLHEDVAFRVLSAGNTPDHSTLARFRKNNLNELAGLFVQVVGLCRDAGLVKLGHVSLDGTKVKANASKRKAMTYKRMREDEERLKRENEQALREGVALDEQEDEQYGDKRGDELPPDLANRAKRLERIQEAMRKLEEREREKTGREDAKPRGKEQYNFTDPESRIMPIPGAKTAYDQQYNAQLVVDAKARVIVAQHVSNTVPDSPHLPLMVDETEDVTGERPVELSADAGYYSETNLACLAERGIDAYVPPDRGKHGRAVSPAPRGRIPKDLSVKDRMRRKLRTKKGRNVYKQRKAIAEPPIGLIKRVLGFRQFSMRGLANAQGEWGFVAAVYDAMVLFWSGRPVPPGV